MVSRSRIVFFLVGVALVAGVVAVAWPRGDERDEAYGVAGAVHSTTDRHVAMGGHLFVQFGCSSCHGQAG